MMKKPEEWLDLISQGESERLELKPKLPVDNVAARTLSAFANTSGGTLILGVGSQGNIIGLTETEVNRAVVRLHNIASSLFSWPTDYGSFDLNGRHLVYVTVSKAPAHLTPVTTSDGTAYLRQGNASVRMDLTQLASTQQAGGGNTKAAKGRRPGSGEIPRKHLVVFVAMSFRFEEEPSLVDYYSAIERTVKKTKLPITLARMDLYEGDYEISKKLMDAIDEADIVLADFTLNSANVYFELGYARGRRKRTIQTARKDTALEFDIRNWRTLFYRNATELEAKLIAELEKACEGLGDTDK